MHEHTSQKLDAQMEIDPPQQELTSTLDQLEIISSRMRSDGYLVSVFTLLNLLALLALRFNFLALYKADLLAYKFLQIGQIGFAVFALANAVLYETLRKRGDAMFEEISDELQWNIRGAKSSGGADLVDERPNLQARIILRTFARASDLPLIPGKFGAGIYAAVNLFALFVEFLFFSKG